jgi:hypothetical protein
MSEQPHTRDEIVQAITEVEAEVAAFFASLSPAEFALRVDQAWTPAEHLRHLNTSVAAVAAGLGVPKLLLRLRFGRARAPSGDYPQVMQRYQEALSRGGTASGKYVPKAEDLPESEAEARRQQIQARWTEVNRRLREALERWTEHDLDRLRMPHPLLGPLTVREMLLFTLYHNRHHVEAASRRLPRFRTAR